MIQPHRSRSTHSLLMVALLALVSVITMATGMQPVTAAGGYTALTPARVLDTRTGVGAPKARVGAGSHIDLKVTGTNGIPESGVAAVVLNVTAINPDTKTFLTVWPAGQPQPATSNLNAPAGAAIPNLVIATVGNGGNISIANQFGTIDIAADITGWYPTGSGYNALTPARVLDTRTGVGAPKARVGAGSHIDLKVTGTNGIPESGVAAVVLNVTAINPDNKTFLTVWPAGQAKPGTSNLNAPAGAAIPNLVIATVGADGKVSMASEFGTIDIAADITGWYPTGSGYNALTPARVVDTRTGVGATEARVSAGGRIDLKVTGTNGIPTSGVAAVVLNVTAINPDTKTFLTVWPAGQPQPATSNLNAPAGAAIPNLVIATVGNGGQISIANQFGTIDIAADVTGWIPGSAIDSTPPPGPAAPTDLSGMVWVANPQPPTVTPGLYGVDPVAGTRTDDLYFVDLVGATTTGFDTHYQFSISQTRNEFYSVEEYDTGTGQRLVMTIRPLDDPTTSRAEVPIPYVSNVPEYFFNDRQFAMSPDGQHLMMVDDVRVYSNADYDELTEVRGSVALIDVDDGEFHFVSADHLYNPQWGPDGDIIAERRADPVTDTASALVRIDGDAFVDGTMQYTTVGTSPGRLLALSNAGTEAAFAVKGAACVPGDADAAELYVWNLVDGSAPHRLAISDEGGDCPKYTYGGVTAAAFSPDDRWVAFSAETFFYCGVSGCYYPNDIQVVANHRSSNPVLIPPNGDDAYGIRFEGKFGEDYVDDRGLGVWWTS